MLNGASSSGKSCLSRELLEVFDEPWFHMPVDAFHAMRARKDLPRPELDERFMRTRRGYHRAVAGMVMAGNSVVADHVLSEPWRLADIVQQWGELDVTMVGVHCPLDELIRREQAREDREPGTAQSQFHVVHSGVEYDCEVDTSARSARECALEIKQIVGARTRTGAFDRLVVGRSSGRYRNSLSSSATRRALDGRHDRGRLHDKSCGDQATMGSIEPLRVLRARCARRSPISLRVLFSQG